MRNKKAFLLISDCPDDKFPFGCSVNEGLEKMINKWKITFAVVPNLYASFQAGIHSVGQNN